MALLTPVSRYRPVIIDRELSLSVAALGVSSIITQIILLREFLAVFYGNELVIGVILTNWMILTAAGSLIGKASDRIRDKMNLMVASLCIMAVLPLLTVFLLDFLRNIAYPPGSMIGIIQVLYNSFVILMPYCLLSGFSFVFFSQAISEKYRANLITNIYSLEAAGSLIGGLIFNIVMVYFLKTFQSLTVLMFFNFTVSFILSLRYSSRPVRYVVLSVAVILLPAAFLSNLDDITRRFLFRAQAVLFYRDTPYGNLTITDQAGQKNFYENSTLLFSAGDIELNEESVHYAMVQHGRPEKVLLISGGLSGTTQEILKYGVKAVDYVEINPWLLEIGKDFTPALSDARVRVINKDARLYVKGSGERYDVVLINVPDPGTAQINRFYTIEFFRDLKKRLNKNAVVSLGLLTSADYWGGEALRISSIMYNTLKASFTNVLIVPGMKNYFIASDNDMGINIAGRIEQRGINNLYVNRYYIDDLLLEERSRDIMTKLDTFAPLNEDFTPVSYYSQLRYWLSYFRFNHLIIASVLLAIIVFSAIRINTISLGIFTGGFAATSIEVMILIAFQVIYGYVYQVTGLIITMFMAGLAAGSLYRHRFLAADINSYMGVQFGIGLYSVLLPFLLLLMKTAAMHYFIIHSVFFLLTFIIAIMVGMEFSIASRLRGGQVSYVASELYSIDLFGSAAGALIVTTYLIPLLGIIRVCFIVAALSFASGLISFAGRKKYA